jgi:hypothetical protein
MSLAEPPVGQDKHKQTLLSAKQIPETFPSDKLKRTLWHTQKVTWVWGGGSAGQQGSHKTSSKMPFKRLGCMKQLGAIKVLLKEQTCSLQKNNGILRSVANSI